MTHKGEFYEYDRGSGVYYIKSIIHNDLYIGSTVHLGRRFNDHKNLLAKNKHRNPRLQHIYNKYGLNNLEFMVIERCNQDADFLRDREKFYIDFFDTYRNGLNCTPIVRKGDSGRKGKPHPHSDATKILMSRIALDRPGRKRDSIKYGKIRIRQGRAVTQKNLDGVLIGIFPTFKAVLEFHGIKGDSPIRRAMRASKPYWGYYYEYTDENLLKKAHDNIKKRHEEAGIEYKGR